MNLTPEQQAAVDEILADAAKWRGARKIDFYEPYPKQAEFHKLGATHDERAMIAGNQVGKSECAAAETAYHLTGEYPSWWEGHRFTHPISAWSAGPNGEKVRDVMQTKLFGHYAKPEEFGSGFVPKDAFVSKSLSRGVTFAYDTVTMKWKPPNGRLDESARSTLVFKSYTEGQLAFASDTIDLYHGDEESSLDIYTEARTRIQVKRGISYLTLTPLLGWTELVTRFLMESAQNRSAVKMGMYDALHYTREQSDQIIAGFPAHLRACKAWGDPAIGEGKVFMTDPDELKMLPFQNVPMHLAKIWGIDFGGAGSGSHPFAAALLAWDRDYDIIYLLRALKLQGMTMLQHIPAIRDIAALVPVAWPHDGNEKDRNSGIILADQYKNPMPGMPGLLMLPEHATWEDGGFSTEAAVNELDDRCKTGRFKVVETETHFADEYRQYHREKGMLVKKNDDVLSAIYKGLMMKRFARPVALGGGGIYKSRRAPTGGTAMDIDPFTGAPVRRLDNSGFF